MCKERGDFGWKSYEETQRIGAGFAEMCNERGKLIFARSLFESIKDYYGCDGELG